MVFGAFPDKWQITNKHKHADQTQKQKKAPIILSIGVIVEIYSIISIFFGKIKIFVGVGGGGLSGNHFFAEMQNEPLFFWLSFLGWFALGAGLIYIGIKQGKKFFWYILRKSLYMHT